MIKKQIVLSYPENPGEFQTDLIQEALDAVRGFEGEVIVEAGDWHIASLRMYSHTTLHLKAGAHLIGSDRWQDYTNYHIDSTLGYIHSPFMVEAWTVSDHYVNAMITACEAEHVSIIGEPGSLIDGQDCYDPNNEEHFRGPMGLVFSKCRCVTLKGYTTQNTGNWSHQLDSCSHVRISDLTLLAGHDGVDLHHCTDIVVEDCEMRTGDDCVAGYDIENLVVRNCNLNTACQTFRIGGSHILVEHCHLWGPGEYPHRVSGDRRNTLAAFLYFALPYDTHRGNSHDWVIRDCVIEGIDRLIRYDFLEDWQQQGCPLGDMTFQRVQITGLLQGSVLKTRTGYPLQLKAKDVTVAWRNGTLQKLDTAGEICYTLDNVKIQGFND